MQAAVRPRLFSRARAVCASAVLALGVACSAHTTETGVWRSPSYAAGPMRSVLVFGGRLSGSERHLLEDGYVATLTAHGVRATPSYTLFPDGQARPEPSAIRSALQSAGYDGALVSTVRGAAERVLVAPGSDWAGGFDGAYWGPAPVSAALDQVVTFETTFWSTSSGQMVWSAMTQTENPTSGSDFVSSLTKTVVPSLANAGLIPPRQGQSVSLLH